MKICLECVTPNPYSAAYCYACGALFTDDLPAGTTHRLQAGQILSNQYLIERPLGQGGMGAVYLANQTIANHTRQVIVKERLDYFDLNDPRGKNKARQLFEKEAATLVKLNIVGVPQIFDFFTEAERNYIVMQYIQGQSLDQRLTRQDRNEQVIPGAPYPPGQVRRWGVQICKILENLVALDIVHMDIKPANLIVDPSENVWLVDFGTARAQDTLQTDTSATTHNSAIFGTSGYAPREQYQHQVEPRSDVYALAATLYHLLTDDDPRYHPFEFPRLDDLPPGLAAALKSALAQDVGQRITASQFRQMLQVRPVVGAAFRWRDGTASHQPEELVEPATRHWVEAREYFSDGSWEQWLLALHRNDLLAGLTRLKDQHQHLDVALDAFLRMLDPEFPLPQLEVTPPSLDFGVIPWKTHHTLDLEIINAGSGCLYGKLVTPTGVQISSSERVRSTNQPPADRRYQPDQEATAKLSAAPPPPTTPLVKGVSPPARPETDQLAGARPTGLPDPATAAALPVNWFATAGHQTFKVTVDTGKLSPRARPYNARLVIKVGLGTPAEVEVPITVMVPKPHLEFSPAVLDLGAANRHESPVGILTITNPGQSPFEGEVQWQANWINLQPVHFRCAAGGSVDLAVMADTGRLDLGRHATTLTIKARAGAWQQSQEVPVKLHLPWLRSLWRSGAAKLDGAATGLILTLGLFVVVRMLFAYIPYLGAFAAFGLIVGGLLAFSLPGLFIVALLVATSVGLAYAADLGLGLAPTLALAGLIGLGLGTNLRSKEAKPSAATGLFGLAVLSAALAGSIYAANQPDVSTYGWHRARTLRADSTGLALSPDGGILASSPQDTSIQLLSLADGAVVRTLSQHKDLVTNVTFSPDGRLLASGSDDTTIWLWQQASGAPVRMLAGHTGRVLSVAFSEDGERLASGTHDGGVWLWHVEDGLLLQTLRGPNAPVTSLGFSLDGGLLAAGAGDAKIRLWQTGDGQLRQVFSAHTGDITGLAFSPDGSLLASSSIDRTVRLWAMIDCLNQAQPCTTSAHTLTGPTAPLASVAFSPDGSLVASGGQDMNVTIWRATDGRRLRTLKGHLAPLHRVAFTPDGSLVSTDEDGITRVWALEAW
jgi:serine/threonine protein kinase